MPHFKELFRAWKAWRKTGWLVRFLGMGNYAPTLEEQAQFDNMDFVRGVQMSDKDLLDKARKNYPKIHNKNTGHLFPVRVYDKDGNLVRTIDVEELKEKNKTTMTKKVGWRTQNNSKKKNSRKRLTPLSKEEMDKMVAEVESEEEGTNES